MKWKWKWQAQLDRARTMGFEPTHLDTHMGTVFGSPEFLMRYIRIGIKNHIPVMLPGGADVLIQDQTKLPDATIVQMRTLGKMLWNAGLPVLDDLHNIVMTGLFPLILLLTIKNWMNIKQPNILKHLKP